MKMLVIIEDTKKEIQMKCAKAGLRIEKIHFAESIGFFVSLAMK